MSEPSPAWLQVLLAAQDAPSPWHAALDHCGGIEAVRAAPAATLAACGIGTEARQRLARTDADRIASWQQWLSQPNHSLVTLDDALYPSRLRAVPGAPLALWLRGARADLLEAPQLAIVGARNATTGGRQNARAFAQQFGRSGLCVISGLAAGIDAAAHAGALQAGGGTLAVLGNGIDTVYPSENTALAQRIAAEGLIVSEYGPGTPPRRYRFPARNRLIAALALGVLVVEAGPQSGSLITARLAGDLGRDVFAIPGSIHNPLSRGCHRLIRDGARLVETTNDVLTELAPVLRPFLEDKIDGQSDQPERGAEDGAMPAQRPESTLSPEYVELLKSIGFDPIGINDIADRSTLTTAELSSMLLLLELEGHVEALPGGRYMRLS